MNIAANNDRTSKWSIRFIRKAVRCQCIAFPSQVPVFRHLHRPEIQWRIVSLYFVQGWSSGKIATRYGITRERVVQLLRQWTSRAIARGYLGRIPSEMECGMWNPEFGPAFTFELAGTDRAA